MNRQLKEYIFQSLNKKEKEITGISDEIWKYCELSMQETKSSKLLSDWLSREGFRTQTGISGMPTAFQAEFSQGSGFPVIVFLAEYDALPGNSNKVVPWHEPIVNGGPGHGCGHNLIGTGNTAAAIVLKDAMRQYAIDGTIRVYGTPGEELLIGKVFMARDGLFNICDVILTSHPASETAANADASYSIVSSEFTFLGESCHATSAPQKGRNALDAVQIANIAVEMRKKYMAPGTVLEYVIPDGGYQPNVVPDFAKVWYFVRHPDVDCTREAYEKIKEAVKGAAIATGTIFQEKVITGCYGYLPNERLGKLIYENARSVGMLSFSDEEKRFANELRKHYGLKEINQPLHEGIEFLRGGLIPASQDDGDASWINPVGRITFAFPHGVPYHGWGYTAASGSSIGHKGMMFCAKALAATAIDVLTVPGVLQEIKKEHKERTKDFKYECLVPNDVMPISEDFMKYHVKIRW